MLERLPQNRPAISDIFRRRRVHFPSPSFQNQYPVPSLISAMQVQEVAAHLNVHLPSFDDDPGSLTSRRKPPPPPSRANLTAITLKNQTLSIPAPPPKHPAPPPPPGVVDDFGAPSAPLPLPPDSDALERGGGMRRPQAARRGGAVAVGGRKIVERYFWWFNPSMRTHLTCMSPPAEKQQ
jgi:hypothetical protein